MGCGVRLTQKSRVVLEMLLSSGIEAVAGSLNFLRALMLVGGWESEADARRRLAGLSEKGWIVWDDSRETGSWVAKVTEEGRAALGEIDLESEWAAEWDGQWRLMSFDLPAAARDQRHALREWLKASRFGHLQGSVLVTHRPASRWLPALGKLKFDPAAAVFFEGSPIGALDHRKLVRKAWDFDAINGAYGDCLRYYSQSGARPSLENEDEPSRFAAWLREESRLWKHATEGDPALPRDLLPAGYLGEKALAARRAAYCRWWTALAEA